MKQFFKFLFASCFGVFLAMFAMFLVGSAIVGSSISKASEPKKVKANSVLHLNFEDPIPQKTNNVDQSSGMSGGFNTDDAVGLTDMVKTIEAAKDDDKIKGIFLDMNSIAAGQTTSNIIRDALIDFKESEKFVIAFGQYYTQGTYNLASVADKVYLHPLGAIDIHGFSREGMYYKDMIDKLGVKMQIFWAGQFKSASEPYRRNNMSPEAKLQAREYLSALWNSYVKNIAEARGIPESEVRNIADTYAIRDAEGAVQYKLADEVAYRDEAIDDIRSRIGLEEDDKLNLADISTYYKTAKKSTDFKIKDKIAVVYAEGIINIGKGSAGEVTDQKYNKIIRDLRKKDDIKAIVMRINSPGGSALASENIWRELKLAQEDGKIVVASMGDVAASGGYYLAAPASKIFAESTTITGSIGVVGAIPSLEEGLAKHIGIHTDTVNVTSGPFSAGFSVLRNMSAEEMAITQKSTEDFYQIFLRRVADGRKMPIDEVHKVAQGRVWIGDKAKELGLVDEMGGLNAAIAEAANLAGLESYRTTEYPKIKDPLNQLIDDLKNGNGGLPFMKMDLEEELGMMYPYFKHMKTIQDRKGIQAIMPYYVEFN